MEDRSSESSGEWVVLNENDELSLDDGEEQPLNLQLSYDAVCDAVSESVKSSLSGEELEWQYEQFQDFIPPYRSSYIEELDYNEIDTECTEDLDVNHSEKDDTNECVTASGFEDSKNVELSSVSKSHCYKHTRNDYLNFVLNLMLALVLALAIGLGVGNFLGWSHKCYKNAIDPNVYTSNLHEAAPQLHSQLPPAVTVMQTVENFADQDAKVLNPNLFSENLSDISCWDPKVGDSSMRQEVCKSHMSNDFPEDAVLPEKSILMSEDVQELKTLEITQNNFSDTALPHVSNIATHTDWNKIDHISETFKNLNEAFERISFQENPSIGNEKSTPEKLFLSGVSEIPLTDTEKSISEEMSSFSSDSFGIKDDVNSVKIELLKQVYMKDDNANKESNLTNQLRQDLSQVIQSLSAVVLAHLTHASDNNLLLVENSGLILKYYSDFENLVNMKLLEIDNFVMNTEYKRYERIRLKHLQNMIYSVIDSVDYLMKMSTKALSRDTKRINVHKFLNNISKVSLNFNKKWEKNSRYWSQNVEKIKFQEIKLQEKAFKKEIRHWKRKSQFEKEYRNNKHQRYFMKS